MSNATHHPAKVQHMEAAAHQPRGPYQSHQTISNFIVSQQVHLPQGQKLYILSHQAHPVQHLELPQIEAPQA
ncbi:MAG: hypothetical protein WBI20_08860 [Burkholderiaceae bacterium]